MIVSRCHKAKVKIKETKEGTYFVCRLCGYPTETFSITVIKDCMLMANDSKFPKNKDDK